MRVEAAYSCMHVELHVELRLYLMRLHLMRNMSSSANVGQLFQLFSITSQTPCNYLHAEHVFARDVD